MTAKKKRTGKALQPVSRAAGAVVPLPQKPASMLEIIARASTDPTVNVDKMNAILDFKQRVEKEEAENAFHAAMKVAKREFGVVVKDKPNPSTNSKYATLENVSKVIDPILSQNGFSLSFAMEQSPLPEHYRIVCDCTHTEHGKAVSFTKRFVYDTVCDAVGMKGNPTKTKIHGIQSAVTYARRNLKLMIFDVAVVGHDDDAAAAGNAAMRSISDAQFDCLMKAIDDVGADKSAFCNFFEIDGINKLPTKDYDRAMEMIARKAGKR